VFLHHLDRLFRPRTGRKLNINLSITNHIDVDQRSHWLA
jgi:hypothetical protein